MLLLIAEKVSHKPDTALLMGKTAMLNHCKAAFTRSQRSRILHSCRLTSSEEETFLAELPVR